MELGLNWAKHSRLKRIDGKEPAYMGENNEYLVLYTKEYLKSHPNINYFIYGHRHIELDLMLSSTARILILGDWINYFSYAVFDGENLFLENFVEERRSYNPHCQTVNHHTITTHETFKTEKHDCRMPARSRSIAGMGTIRRPDTCHPH